MPDREHDPTADALRAASRAVYAEAPQGVVRRLGLALVNAKIRRGPSPTLGRFLIRRKIGEGGMGSVFEAFDPRLDRAVALKVLRDSASGATRVDIEHEGRMLARLSHPNVVTVYELAEESGEQYVCMEYVDGPNLAAWISANPDATWRTLVGHLLGAARGLAAAHRAGVVHRDFKPENVLIGSDGIVRVSDFGLARTSDAVAGSADPTVDPSTSAAVPEGMHGMASDSLVAESSVSTLVGTPGYVAPEVLRGGRATEKSDQYSFFVTMRVALRHASVAPPPSLDVLRHRGVASEPEARWPDMSSVVTAIEQVLERQSRPDQRSRDVLAERVHKLWVEPIRASAFRSGGRELPLRAEPVDEYVDTAHPLRLGEGSPPELAAALHTLVAGVVLVGAPGAGKTLRMLGIAEALLARAREADDSPLPVVLNLSSFAAFDGSLSDWLLHELIAKYALPRQQASYWLARGELALLLDGLDEMPPAHRPRCVAAINALRAERPTPYVVACRERNYGALPAMLRGDAALRLGALDASEVGSILRAPDVDPRLAELVRDDPALAEQLRSPLLLGLFSQLASGLATFTSGADTLRDRLYELGLARAFERTPRLEGKERASTEAGLRWLAAAMSRAGVTELWLEEMQASWLPRAWQRWMAQGLGVSAALAISIAINLVASRVAMQPWYSGLFFGVVAALAAFFIAGGLRIAPMEAMRWSWPRVRTWIPRNLALGFVMGAMHGIFSDFWADVMLGVATGVFGLSVIGLVPAGRERRVDPGDGLRESFRNGLVVGPLIGVVIGVPVGYLVLPLARPFAEAGSMYHTHPNPELSWAVTLGTSGAVTSLYITGFLAPLMHAALRITIAITTPLPLRLTAWLDDLADRDLLNRVGGGWLFRHPTFRAWLAELPESPEPPRA